MLSVLTASVSSLPSAVQLQSEGGGGHLSKMIPDIAMATATLEHLDLAESDKDDYGSCEADDLSPVHMLV